MEVTRTFWHLPRHVLTLGSGVQVKGESDEKTGGCDRAAERLGTGRGQASTGRLIGSQQLRDGCRTTETAAEKAVNVP